MVFKNIKYFGMNLASYLRWVPYYRLIALHIFKWFNYLTSITGSNWEFHLSSLLLIYKSVSRTKSDYDSFLITTVSFVHFLKLNVILASYFHSHFSAIGFLSLVFLEVEYVCALLESVRSKKSIVGYQILTWVLLIPLHFII